MLNWILVRTSRVLDWVLVILVVFALVFVCQFLVDMFTPPNADNNDDKG